MVAYDTVDGYIKAINVHKPVIASFQPDVSLSRIWFNAQFPDANGGIHTIYWESKSGISELSGIEGIRGDCSPLERDLEQTLGFVEAAVTAYGGLVSNIDAYPEDDSLIHRVKLLNPDGFIRDAVDFFKPEVVMVANEGSKGVVYMKKGGYSLFVDMPESTTILLPGAEIVDLKTVEDKFNYF